MEDARVLASTCTVCPRGALKPVICALTRYGPGASERSVTRPSESVTPNTVPAPVAETTAPATGTPDSSWTRLSIVPDVPDVDDGADAVRVAVCARTRSGAHTIPTPTARAINPDACLMFPPAATGRAVIRR